MEAESKKAHAKDARRAKNNVSSLDYDQRAFRVWHGLRRTGYLRAGGIKFAIRGETSQYPRSTFRTTAAPSLPNRLPHGRILPRRGSAMKTPRARWRKNTAPSSPPLQMTSTRSSPPSTPATPSNSTSPASSSPASRRRSFQRILTCARCRRSSPRKLCLRE